MSPLNDSTKKRRSTIADVAKAAGVSPTTVSFVLNGTPGQTISPATRKHIMKTIRDLRYEPNAYARALGKGHSNEIAQINFEALHSFSMLEWTAAIQDRTLQLGYTPGTYLYQGASRRTMRSIIESVLARRPVGILATARYFTKADFMRARDMGVRACVVLDTKPVGYTPTITIPYEEAGRLVGAHLRERGHRRVAFVTPVAPTLTRQVVWLDCIKGLRYAMRQSDVTLSELPMESSLESARAAVDRLLSCSERPTAIFGFTDDYSLPLLKALLERGIQVPKDIAMVGTEDTYLCSLVHPALTSVRFDMQTIGAHAVDIIDALMRNKEPSPELFVSPPPQLIIRESS